MNNWGNKDANDENYQQKRAIAKDAHYSGCWIYVPATDKWYTPKEFVESTETIRRKRGADNSSDYKIRDPKSGLIEKIKQLEKLQNEVKDFSNRLFEYYDLKQKK